MGELKIWGFFSQFLKYNPKEGKDKIPDCSHTFLGGITWVFLGFFFVKTSKGKKLKNKKRQKEKEEEEEGISSSLHSLSLDFTDSPLQTWGILRI